MKKIYNKISNPKILLPNFENTVGCICILSVKSPLVTLHDIGMVSVAFLIQTQTCIPFFLALVSGH